MSHDVTLRRLGRYPPGKRSIAKQLAREAARFALSLIECRPLDAFRAGSDDIRLMLPQEACMFDEVHTAFMRTLSKIQQDTKVLRACAIPGILGSLNEMNEKLDRLQKSLDDYLEKKR